MQTQILKESDIATKKRQPGERGSGNKANAASPLQSRRVRALRCPICEERYKPGTARCMKHDVELEPVDSLLGKVIDQTYRLEKLIGIGGMGDVYLARHITLDGPFAVKILSPKHSRQPLQVKRFHHEARAQGRLDHDSALRVIRHGHDRRYDLHFVAMEHIAGHTLRSEIKRHGPLGVKRAVDIIGQVLGAIQKGHDLGELHRDLKPGNIMLTAHAGQTDRVRVLDFGGKAIERGLPSKTTNKARTVLTSPGMLFGTPAYMAPEQARGEKLDERADIYAAAVTLAHMLIGHCPYKGSDIADTLARVLTMPAPRPSLFAHSTRNIPPGLEAVLLKALSRDPELRFESARAFRRALQKFSRPVECLPGAAMEAEEAPSTRECLLRVFRSVEREVQAPRAAA